MCLSDKTKLPQESLLQKTNRLQVLHGFERAIKKPRIFWQKVVNT